MICSRYTDNLETGIQISRSWRISWQNQWLFLQSFSYVSCTHRKTTFTKKIKLTLFMVSFALTTKKKITQKSQSTHF